jgi:hypothetical protein
MITQELVRFIKEQIEKGKSEEDIRQALLLQGWRDIDINEGFNVIKNPISNIPTPTTDQATYNGLFRTGQLISHTFSLYKKNFWKFGLIGAIYGIAVAIIMFFSFFLITLLGNNFVINIILLAIAGIIAGILTIAGSYSMILVAAQNDEKMSLRNILSTGIKQCIPFFGFNVIDSLITMGTMILSIGLLCIFAWKLSSFSPGLIAILILAIILAIPGIIISTYLAFSQYVFIFEKKKPLDSFSISLAYVKGNWWKILGRLGLFGIMIAAMGIVLSLILSLIPSKSIREIISNIVSILVFTPLTLNFIYLLYKNVREIKQNTPVVSYKKWFIALIILGLVGFAGLVFMFTQIFNSLSRPMELDTFSPQEYNLPINGAPNASLDARIKADMSQVRDVAQVIYIETNSYATVCANSTLGTSVELSTIATDITENGGIAYCAASSNAYCITSPLNNGQFECVDSTGVFKSYDTFPACSPLSPGNYACD